MLQLNENGIVPAEDLVFKGATFACPIGRGLGIRLDRDVADHYARWF